MLRSVSKKFVLTCLAALFFIQLSFSQTIVKGKVTDGATGDPIPFANVLVKGTHIGTTTDFDGNYYLKFTVAGDTLQVTYVGFYSKSKYFQHGEDQVINFQLQEEVMNLKEMVFLAGENPAFSILRKVVKNKEKNNKWNLDAFQYESYNKIEIDIDNITEKARKGKIMQKVTSVMDSINELKGEDGNPILPVFISESLSEFYYRNSPKLNHEKILKTKMTGVGIEDGTLVSQLIGSTFQNYNFYENWLNILEKDFVSPIAEGWKNFYDYDLTDSLFIDDQFCYRLDFFPKREQDLAFWGTMWITKKDFALKQIDASVLPVANLNFVEKIKIQQELIPTSAGPWLPTKTRILINIGELKKEMAGMLLKFYTSNTNIVVNKPHDEKFYNIPIAIAKDFNRGNGDEFWDARRHEPLSHEEKIVYQMIDTLRNIPVVKTYTEIMKIAVNGYAKAGKFDVGPYLNIYSNNNIEGHRFQLGGRTNIKFSDKWVFGGHIGYGTKDERFKYRGYTKFIPDKEWWTSFSFEYQKDIDQVGLEVDELAENFIFLAATRFGTLTKPYQHETFRFSASRDIFKGFQQSLSIKNSSFDPLFNFAYKLQPELSESPLANNYKTTEISLESRFAKDEFIVINDNDRISMGTKYWPIIKFRYTVGIKDIMSSDFNYHKVRLTMKDKIVLGVLGASYLTFTAEKIFGALPYPLLETHVGNESLFYTNAAFNLMGFSEFASDQYVSLKYNHYFEGLILNRIPLMKKLKWRLLATANVVHGTLNEKNQSLIPLFDNNNQPIQQLSSLRNTPYIEVGYGIENIFKIGRIDFLHRLTHLNKPDVNKFGIKVSFQFLL